jgi:hypothetical protein
MRKIRDMLRLTYALGMSRRLVSEATGIGKTAVGEYVRRTADAILDRLVHNAHRITLKGESMRKTAANRAGLDVQQDA